MRRHITRAVCAAAAAGVLISPGFAWAWVAGAASTARPALAPPGSEVPVTAYVVNRFSRTVTPIRTATNRALAKIKVGTGPIAIAITP